MPSTPDGEPNAGMAAAGSQRLIQIYVNERREVLDEQVRACSDECTHATLDWRSPLAEDVYREYWDASFLEALVLAHIWPALTSFWPKGGPHWDALAVVSRPSARPGVLLVEAKAHISELLNSSPIGAAVAEVSRRQIELAMAWTMGTLNVCDRPAASWCDTPLYQSANRLAHLQWLNCHSIDAWLLHALFTGDHHIQAATEPEWQTAIAEANRHLGLPGDIGRASHIILPAV